MAGVVGDVGVGVGVDDGGGGGADVGILRQTFGESGSDTLTNFVCRSCGRLCWPSLKRLNLPVCGSKANTSSRQNQPRLKWIRN